MKNYYNEIKEKLIDNEIFERVKDYSKERNRVITYFEIGRLLSEAGGKYGDNIIGEYSKRLVIEVGKKYNRRTLYRMKQFYILFNNEKVSTMWTQLTWSSIREMLAFDDIFKINYYINISSTNNLTVRELKFKIKSKEYERLDVTTKLKLVNDERIELKDLIPSPIIIKNNSNYEVLSERILQKLILEDISSFLKELGNGFTFVDSEYKIRLGDSYNYTDLLLFNYEYNCFVVIELKVTELKKEHIGQIEVYMNYIDKNLKKITQDKTIGIIICKKNNEYIIEYCSDKRIISKEYKVIDIK